MHRFGPLCSSTPLPYAAHSPNHDLRRVNISAQLGEEHKQALHVICVVMFVIKGDDARARRGGGKGGCLEND